MKKIHLILFSLIAILFTACQSNKTDFVPKYNVPFTISIESTIPTTEVAGKLAIADKNVTFDIRPVLEKHHAQLGYSSIDKIVINDATVRVAGATDEIDNLKSLQSFSANINGFAGLPKINLLEQKTPFFYEYENNVTTDGLIDYAAYFKRENLVISFEAVANKPIKKEIKVVTTVNFTANCSL